MRRLTRKQPATVDRDFESIHIDTKNASCVKSNELQRGTISPSGQNLRADRSVTAPTADPLEYKMHVKLCLFLIFGSFALFRTLITLRDTLRSPPVPLELSINMFLAGTIIFAQRDQHFGHRTGHDRCASVLGNQVHQAGYDSSVARERSMVVVIAASVYAGVDSFGGLTTLGIVGVGAMGRA
ncbi:unnamed protein product [Rhizoctonia solani]|uniref:Uncharacterized protein n=1 Tax=Rhizoctonia solani TaxID=456999 RepID=A0A8H3GF66_9AGAM|nr:unnamed protein product [Rhizoctonia solani]